jgi:hypothetical protein
MDELIQGRQCDWHGECSSWGVIAGWGGDASTGRGIVWMSPKLILPPIRELLMDAREMGVHGMW